MSSGVGRGRGWLNLKQNQNTPNSTAVVGTIASPPITPANVKEEIQFVDIPNDNNDLVNKIKQLNLSDDGILFNQKIKYIIKDWNKDCRTSEEVE